MTLSSKIVEASDVYVRGVLVTSGFLGSTWPGPALQSMPWVQMSSKCCIPHSISHQSSFKNPPDRKETENGERKAKGRKRIERWEKEKERNSHETNPRD